MANNSKSVAPDPQRAADVVNALFGLVSQFIELYRRVLVEAKLV